MSNLIEIIANNLISVGYGIGIFLLSYLSNMCFGCYYNINIMGQKFDWKKIGRSLIKVLCVGIGIVLLTLAITLILPFAQENGLPIPDEYGEVIKIFAILIICLIASLKYITEALDKFKKILNGTKDQAVESEEKIAEEEQLEEPAEKQEDHINFED